MNEAFKTPQALPAGYSDEEFARLGDAIYEHAVRPQVGPDDDGKFVAIDVESGHFELDANPLVAMKRLVARRPGAEFWLTRVGRGYAHRYGPRQGRRQATATP